MKHQIPFSNDIAPPQSCDIGNQTKSNTKQAACTRIPMKKEHSTHCLEQKTKSGLSWPGAWVHNVIRMVWNVCLVVVCVHVFVCDRLILCCSCSYFFCSFTKLFFERNTVGNYKMKGTRRHIFYCILTKMLFVFSMQKKHSCSSK